MKLCLMILSVPWYMFNGLEHTAILSHFLTFITGSSSRLLRIRFSVDLPCIGFRCVISGARNLIHQCYGFEIKILLFLPQLGLRPILDNVDCASLALQVAPVSYYCLKKLLDFVPSQVTPIIILQAGKTNQISRNVCSLPHNKEGMGIVNLNHFIKAKQVKCMHNITHSELDTWNAMYMLSGCELIDTEYISLLSQNMKFIFCRAG